MPYCRSPLHEGREWFSTFRSGQPPKFCPACDERIAERNREAEQGYTLECVVCGAAFDGYRYLNSKTCDAQCRKDLSRALSRVNVTDRDRNL